MLTGLTVVFILQYIQILNYYIVHLKLIYCYVNYIPIFKKFFLHKEAYKILTWNTGEKKKKQKPIHLRY